MLVMCSCYVSATLSLRDAAASRGLFVGNKAHHKAKVVALRALLRRAHGQLALAVDAVLLLLEQIRLHGSVYSRRRIM